MRRKKRNTANQECGSVAVEEIACCFKKYAEV